LGVASNRSIAWCIAQARHRDGCELAFTYQNERLRERVEKFAGELDSDIVIPCNVEDDDAIEAVFEHLDDYWDSVDSIIHSIAYAPKELLEGDYLDNLTRDGFNAAHECQLIQPSRYCQSRTSYDAGTSRCFDYHTKLPWCSTHLPWLQRDGSCQGKP